MNVKRWTYMRCSRGMLAKRLSGMDVIRFRFNRLERERTKFTHHKRQHSVTKRSKRIGLWKSIIVDYYNSIRPFIMPLLSMHVHHKWFNAKNQSFVHSFIETISIAPLQVHYYSEALQTQYGYCVGSLTPKHHRKLRVKDLPKVPTWRLERDSNPRPFRQNATNLPMSHHAPLIKWW